MDRRTQPREAACETVTLKLLDESKERWTVRLTDLSPSGARLEIPVPLAPGTLVRLDTEDRLILGEICHCATNRDGKYVAGMKIEHVLNNLPSLLRLRDALAGERTASPAPASAPASNSTMIR